MTLESSTPSTIIDNGVVSVTVVCDSGIAADALSTALFCMSYEEGRALVDALDSVEVIWVTKTGEKYTTDGIDRMRSRE